MPSFAVMTMPYRQEGERPLMYLEDRSEAEEIATEMRRRGQLVEVREVRPNRPGPNIAASSALGAAASPAFSPLVRR